MAPAKPLTPRQQRFVEAFFDMGADGARFCAAKAARIAGYRWPRQQGARLMTFAHVRAEIDRREEAELEAIRQRGLAQVSAATRSRSRAGR